MPLFVGNYMLDDAIAFLMEAKGLPSISTSTERLRRCLRACIFLSWAALEDGIESAISDWKKRGKDLGQLPSALKGRLATVLLVSRGMSLDENEYSKLRKIRNALTHPADSQTPPVTLEIAEQTFNFCLVAYKGMTHATVVCPWSDPAVQLDKTLEAHRMIHFSPLHRNKP